MLNFFLFVMLSICYQALLWTGPVSFLVNYKLLFSFSFLWSYFDFFTEFCFLKRTKFLMSLLFVVCVWFCCSSLLAFLILAYLITLMPHFFFTSLCYLLWRLFFRSYNLALEAIRFEKYLNFWVFLCVPHLVDNYAKIVDERGRNFMCNRTLPSLLVLFLSPKINFRGKVARKFCAGNENKCSSIFDFV